MAILDFDIASLFKKKNDSGEKEKPSLDKTILVRGAIVLVLFVVVFSVYFFLLRPTLNEQKNQIKDAAIWKQQIVSCELEIKNLEENISILKNESSLKGGLFVSNDEFENFYAELTEATIQSGLRILDITRGDELPVRLAPEAIEQSTYNYVPVSVSIPCEKDSKFSNNSTNSSLGVVDPNCEGDECNPIAYYKMTVSYKIQGSFGNYLQFRNILANKKKIVNIEKENVTKTESGNGVTAIATVSLVKNIK